MKTLDDSLCFYNAGKNAGASQPHKHIQVIPMSSIPGNEIPINQRVLDAMARAS